MGDGRPPFRYLDLRGGRHRTTTDHEWCAMFSGDDADFALLLFLPGAEQQISWPLLDEAVAPLDLVIRGVLPITHSPAVYAALDKGGGREIGDMGPTIRWRLADLLSQDMGFAVLASSGRGGAPLPERLNELKKPFDGGQDTAMRLLFPVDGHTSLVHIPETVEATRRQAGLLFDGLNSDHTLSRLSRGPAGFSELSRLRGYIGLQAAQARFGPALCVIGRALLTLLWDPRLAPEPNVVAAAARLDQALPGDEAAALDAVAEILAQCDEPSVHGRGMRDVPRRLVGRYWDLISAARTLAACKRLSVADGQEIVRIMACHGLFMDSLERHFLYLFCLREGA